MALPTKVRVTEVVALEGDPGPIGARAGIGETIAHIQLGRMVHDLAELLRGIAQKLLLPYRLNTGIGSA